MPQTVKLSQEVQTGDNLVNLGVVTTVELHPNEKEVRIVILTGKVQSCAFFWYNYDIPLTLQIPTISFQGHSGIYDPAFLFI